MVECRENYELCFDFDIMVIILPVNFVVEHFSGDYCSFDRKVNELLEDGFKIINKKYGEVLLKRDDLEVLVSLKEKDFNDLCGF